MARQGLNERGRRWLMPSATLGAILIGWTQVAAQSFSPYSDFQAMTLDQLKTLQVKLTYVGPQRDVIPSVAFTSPLNTLDMSKFVPFRRPGLSYANDDISFHPFTASQTELKAVIDNVGMLPSVTAGGVAADPRISYAMCNNLGATTKGFEAVLNLADAADLFAKLRLALIANQMGRRVLDEMACPMTILDPARPTDVSSSVLCAVTGVRLNRATGRFNATATCKNNSAAAIAGPVSLVLEFKGNVRLFNVSGFTCGTTPVGRSFINMPLTGAALPAGGSTSATLDLDNPDREPVQTVLLKVLAGPGSR